MQSKDLTERKRDRLTSKQQGTSKFKTTNHLYTYNATFHKQKGKYGNLAKSKRVRNMNKATMCKRIQDMKHFYIM